MGRNMSMTLVLFKDRGGYYRSRSDRFAFCPGVVGSYFGNLPKKFKIVLSATPHEGFEKRRVWQDASQFTAHKVWYIDGKGITHLPFLLMGHTAARLKRWPSFKPRRGFVYFKATKL